ncbi:MAG: hypothetical protein US20_C0023G0007 [Candidatus Pacebacteria bacterium GW2011_GWF1_36_5]|nr:MAG: hypothetical protein US20_C0023G0007 [Candidatus Pacebacteria bacterium GW2011_GWF1_36_5]
MMNKCKECPDFKKIKERFPSIDKFSGFGIRLVNFQCGCGQYVQCEYGSECHNTNKCTDCLNKAKVLANKKYEISGRPLSSILPCESYVEINNELKKVKGIIFLSGKIVINIEE